MRETFVLLSFVAGLGCSDEDVFDFCVENGKAADPPVGCDGNSVAVLATNGCRVVVCSGPGEAPWMCCDYAQVGEDYLFQMWQQASGDRGSLASVAADAPTQSASVETSSSMPSRA